MSEEQFIYKIPFDKKHTILRNAKKNNIYYYHIDGLIYEFIGNKLKIENLVQEYGLEREEV